MEAMFSTETPVDSQRNNGVISQKIVLCRDGNNSEIDTLQISRRARGMYNTCYGGSHNNVVSEIRSYICHYWE
jgi:hypothetical protein